MNWLKKIFCRHKNVKRMTEGDYFEWSIYPDKWVLAIYEDCDKIIDGRWVIH